MLESEGGGKNGMLSENLNVFRDNFEDGEQFIEFPVGMTPIGNKGQFFDIAFNYIAFPEVAGGSGEVKVEKQETDPEKKSEGGWAKMFGF